MRYRLKVNPIACDGHGICAELFPERVTLDDWGYPIIGPKDFDERLLSLAKQACAGCPVMALSIEPVIPADPPARVR